MSKSFLVRLSLAANAVDRDYLARDGVDAVLADPATRFLVLRDGLALAGIGAAVGLTGAVALGRLLAAFMPRVVSVDPGTLLAVTAVLFLAVLAACWIPARRATQVDPLLALRAE